ncbi:hypothetical protein [Luteimonas sp. YGD11-2]|uniref:hypothetical protein n=1 Tax=Luteimonas sp. YGD11-2 TaxID=2508168 RepID=UPI00100BBBF7|nr:hypothetical protein [Luteimonas sp. YGD11-2]
MATESVAKHAISTGDIERIRWLLLDGIKANSELQRLKENVASAAAAGWQASALLSFQPHPIDFDLTEAAEMIQVLSVLEPVEEGGA